MTAAVGACLAGVAVATAGPAAAVLPHSTNGDWATIMLNDGNFPTSANNINVVLEWMDSEEPASHWWNRNNPLNSSLGTTSSNGTGSYDDLYRAATESAATLHNGLYPTVVADLNKSAAVDTTAKAIQDSPWASSHYGHGSAWHYGSVPRYEAPAKDWEYPGS